MINLFFILAKLCFFYKHFLFRNNPIKLEVNYIVKKLLGIVITCLSFAGILLSSTNNVFADSPSRTETFKFLKNKLMTYGNCRQFVGGGDWCDIEIQVELNGNTLTIKEKTVVCNDGLGDDIATQTVDISELDPTRTKSWWNGSVGGVKAYCTGNKECNLKQYKSHTRLEYLILTLPCSDDLEQSHKLSRAFRNLIKLSGGKGELF